MNVEPTRAALKRPLICCTPSTWVGYTAFVIWLLTPLVGGHAALSLGDLVAWSYVRHVESADFDRTVVWSTLACVVFPITWFLQRPGIRLVLMCGWMLASAAAVFPIKDILFASRVGQVSTCIWVGVGLLACVMIAMEWRLARTSRDRVGETVPMSDPATPVNLARQPGMFAIKCCIVLAGIVWMISGVLAEGPRAGPLGSLFLVTLCRTEGLEVPPRGVAASAADLVQLAAFVPMLCAASMRSLAVIASLQFASVAAVVLLTGAIDADSVLQLLTPTVLLITALCLYGAAALAAIVLCIRRGRTLTSTT